MRSLVSGLWSECAGSEGNDGVAGIRIDHSTIHRWVVHFSPLLLKCFNHRERSVGSKWYMDETHIKVRGQWMYIYRAIDSVGDTVAFCFSEHRDLPAAKRFRRKALQRYGRPDRIAIEVSQTDREAITSFDGDSRLGDRTQCTLKAIRIRQFLSNLIKQDHCRIKRRMRPMLGFKTFLRGGSCHTGRHQDVSYDAEAAGPLRL